VVHHLVPFAVDPSRLCDPLNLRTVCDPRTKDRGCHLKHAQRGSFRLWIKDEK
jgi:hypothetical protein